MQINFSAVHTPAAIALVKIRLVQGLGACVADGLDAHASPVRGASVVNTILAALADSAANGVLASDVAPPELERLVLTAYFDEYDRVNQSFLKERVRPVPVTTLRSEEPLLLERYGAQEVRTQGLSPLDEAVATAWTNLRRAQRRWLAWMCLASLFNATPAGRNSACSEKTELTAVSHALLAGERLMKARLLMVALLAGGESAEEVKNWLKRTAFHPNMSIMEYLSLDGQLPGRWETCQEEMLREAINRA